MTKALYTFLFLVSCCLMHSQINKAVFLEDFNKANSKDKVKMVANADFADIKEIYSKISDTLDRIKDRVYKNSRSDEAKFLFALIEAKQAIYFKKYNSAALTLENSLSTHSRNGSDSLMCYWQLKDVYIKLNNLNKAVEANLYYDKLAIRSKDPKYINNIAKKSKIYDVFGLYRQAITERRREYNEVIQLKKNDTDFIAGYLNDQGVYFNRLKMSDSALPYFKRAHDLISKKLSYTSNKPNYQFFKGLIEGNTALAYTNKGDYKNAIPLLKNDVYYSLKVSDHESAFNSYSLLTKCYIEMGNIPLARKYADSAIVLNEKIGRPKFNLKTLLMEAELLDEEGRHHASAEKYRMYISLKDSITNNEKELQLINEQVALDIQKKDLQIIEKNQQLQNSEVSAAKQRAFRAYLMAGLVILMVVIAFLFYTNNSSKKREYELAQKNEQIQTQNKLIEASLKEKDMLLREIHHRVKNNLQIISSVLNLQADKINDTKLKEILSEIKLRISSIALTHQMLYQRSSLSHVQLNEYLQNLSLQISQSFDNEHIQIRFENKTADLKIGIDLAIPLGLLINEIITNAYKHAFVGMDGGKIDVLVNTTGNEIEVIIRDNGKGLPKGYEQMIENPSTLGFELISILSDQIRADLNLTNNNGAQFKLKFRV